MAERTLARAFRGRPHTRNSPPGSSRLAHSRRSASGLLFDIVKSECVRPSGSGPPPAAAIPHRPGRGAPAPPGAPPPGLREHAEAAETGGPIQPRRTPCFSKRGREMRPGDGEPDRPPPRTRSEAKVFMARPRRPGRASMPLLPGWASMMRAIKCHKGVWWMPWR